MKLAEICKTPALNNSETFPKIDWSSAKHIGSMTGDLNIFELKEDNLIYFLCKKNNVDIGYYAMQEISICKLKGFIIKRSFIIKSERNKGYGSDLFKFIKAFLNATIFSDEYQTDDSQLLWKSLSKRFQVKVLKTQTGEIFNKSEINVNILYTLDDKSSADYLMFVENFISIVAEQSKHSNITLPEYRFFENGDF